MRIYCEVSKVGEWPAGPGEPIAAVDRCAMKLQGLHVPRACKQGRKLRFHVELVGVLHEQGFDVVSTVFDDPPDRIQSRYRPRSGVKRDVSPKVWGARQGLKPAFRYAKASTILNVSGWVRGARASDIPKFFRIEIAKDLLYDVKR